MAINWGSGWYVYSEANGDTTRPEAAEKMIVENMIRNSDKAQVQNYYLSTTGGDVYVKCGIHVSASEPTRHVTVTLGYGQAPWVHPAWPSYTAHIKVTMTGATYDTDIFPGLPTDSKKKINNIKKTGGFKKTGTY